MDKIVISPSDEFTWPEPLSYFLKMNLNIFLEQEKTTSSKTFSYAEVMKNVHETDKAIYVLTGIFKQYFIKGYHYTKLTEREIKTIKEKGMLLPNLARLENRLNDLVSDNSISSSVAEKLKTENQANDHNRANMIWFCLYPPYEASANGIKRFFTSWGGEALYNSHEKDVETGPILKSISSPCIIEAEIPIQFLYLGFLSTVIYKKYLFNRKLINSRVCS